MDGTTGGTDRVVHDMDETRERQFDWSTTRPSRAVVEVVSAAVGREATEIEPLAERVDPDALDTVMGRESQVDEPAVTVSFAFADRHVTVSADGFVTVRPLDVGRTDSEH